MATYIFRTCQKCGHVNSIVKGSETYVCKECETESNVSPVKIYGEGSALIDPYVLGRKKADPLFREYLKAVGCNNVD